MAEAPFGTVYLLGAGPGDPELLTLRAIRLLRSADVVLHDDLVSPEILALIPKSVRVIGVGKRCGAAKITQSEIHRILIDNAAAGYTVVRLKSGDPMLFGRAGEELDALRDAGISVEVVPGVTAALAAAAELQVPLTDRRVAARVCFSSGHHASDAAKDHRLATTQVIYMPGSNYADTAKRLHDDGIPEDTPCVIASDISRQYSQWTATTIAELSGVAPLPAPSILIVGEGCRRLLVESTKSTALLPQEQPGCGRPRPRF
jgi:uroporphyrin-III C-methyltransferase